VHLQEMFEETTVGIVVEILGSDDEGDLIEDLWEQQNTAQDGLLGVQTAGKLAIKDSVGRAL